MGVIALPVDGVSHFEPYFEARQNLQGGKVNTIFHARNRFQIISGGRDGKFGIGGPWPLQLGPIQNLDRDNLSNLAERRMELGR